MITAKKSRWFESVFAFYSRNLFWRRFQKLEIRGIENLRARDRKVPLVLYANHSSWWDGLVAFEIGRRAHLDHFVMMEEQQLRKLFLFRRLGAFGVVRENAREALKSIRYATSLLKEQPNRALWIFPQGEILPNDRRPLKFYNGAAQIMAETSKCYVAPVAMRYEFIKDFKPTAFVQIGELMLFENVTDKKMITDLLTNNLTCLLDDLKQSILNQPH